MRETPTPKQSRLLPAVRARAWAKRLQGPGGTILYFLRRMGQDGITSTAASLCYATALAVVPALAVVLGMLGAFPAFAPLRESLQSFMFSNLLPDTGIKLQSQMETFIAAAGKLTAFGVMGLAITAIMLILTIEGAFNRIFRVTHVRPLLFRLVVFWVAMTVGPFLITMSLSLFGFFSGVVAHTLGKEIMKIVLGWIAPTVLTWVALGLLYMTLPSRRVRLHDAAIGSFVSAVLFAILRDGFGFYVKSMTSYSAIYGALAAVPVFLVWIYLIWIVIMAGAVIAAALPDWRLMRSGLASGPARKLALALEILRCLSISFRTGSPMTLGKMAVDTGCPEAALLPVLEELRSISYVATTEGGGWVLNRDLGQVPLVDMIHRLGFGVGPVVEELRHADLGQRAFRHLEQAAKSERELLKMDVAQVVASEKEKPAT